MNEGRLLPSEGGVTRGAAVAYLRRFLREDLSLRKRLLWKKREGPSALVEAEVAMTCLEVLLQKDKASAVNPQQIP